MSASPEEIQELEELTVNAWPGHRTIVYDGWVMRFAGGHTRRANSISPLYAGRLDPVQKIDYCRQLYRGEHLPLVFKLTTSPAHAELDDIVAKRGFEENGNAAVETLDLGGIHSVLAEGAITHDRPDESWVQAYVSMNEVPAAKWEALRGILRNIVEPTCYLTIELEGQVAACGLAVAQGKHVGLYDIVVHPSMRRRGVGRSLIQHLLAWGKKRGAAQAYLQVMTSNAAAMGLYASLGFDKRYEYWYRTER